MSQYKPDGLITLKSNGDYRTAGQYYIVVAAAGDTCAVAGAGGAAVHPIGVLQNKPNTNEFATIATRGTSKVIMAENCTAGDVIVGCDAASGKGEVADADKEIGVGIALQSNSAGDGVVIEVLLCPGISHHA